MAELETLAAEQEAVRPPDVKCCTSPKDYKTSYRCSVDGDAFWADTVNELVWTTPWHTVRELYTQVCRVANGLKRSGVQKGDQVVIDTPLTLGQDPGDVWALE